MPATPTTHCIHRQVLEIRIRDLADPFPASHEIGRICRDKLPSTLEAVFGRFASDGRHVRLDRLELDLGVLAWDHIEEQLLSRLQEVASASLAKALARAGRTTTGGIEVGEGAAATVGRPVVRSAEQSDQEILRGFLATGVLPWFAPASAGHRLEAMLQAELQANAIGFCSWLREHEQRRSIAVRLVNQFSGAVLFDLIRVVAVAEHGSHARPSDRLAHTLAATEPAGFGRVEDPELRDFAIAVLSGCPADHPLDPVPEGKHPPALENGAWRQRSPLTSRPEAQGLSSSSLAPGSVGPGGVAVTRQPAPDAVEPGSAEDAGATSRPPATAPDMQVEPSRPKLAAETALASPASSATQRKPDALPATAGPPTVSNTEQVEAMAHLVENRSLASLLPERASQAAEVVRHGSGGPPSSPERHQQDPQDFPATAKAGEPFAADVATPPYAGAAQDTAAKLAATAVTPEDANLTMNGRARSEQPAGPATVRPLAVQGARLAEADSPADKTDSLNARPSAREHQMPQTAGDRAAEARVSPEIEGELPSDGPREPHRPTVRSTLTYGRADTTAAGNATVKSTVPPPPSSPALADAPDEAPASATVVDTEQPVTSATAVGATPTGVKARPDRPAPNRMVTPDPAFVARAIPGASLPSAWTESLSVDNAGLPILHPFLRPYFEAVGIMQNGSFTSFPLRCRAVCLLQWLAYGEVADQEHRLPLAKMLCGLPVETPIPRVGEPTAAEQREADELLAHAIKSWPVLKNTSVGGFRRSFLQREGLLTRRVDGWHLRIEARPYDMLFGSLPWGFSLVKLSWMSELLRVER